MLKTFDDEKKVVSELFANMHEAWVEGDVKKTASFFHEPCWVILRHHKINAETHEEFVKELTPIRERVKGHGKSHYAPFRIKLQMWSSNFALAEIPDITRTLKDPTKLEVSRFYCIAQYVESRWGIVMAVVVEE